MRSAGRRFPALLAYTALLWSGGCASASADDLFGQASQSDVARAWLDLLFRGIPLPAGLIGDAHNLDTVAAALHRALGVYSMSILVLAGLLLFYNLAVMIIETAHYGVPLGRRSSQVWAPIRLVLAIGFLVPVSGGLNTGQYLVTWMAEQGSSIASRAWGVAVTEMKGSFSGIAAPHGPDVAGFVAGGLDMELCRSLYRRVYAALPANSIVRQVGIIGDIEKLPRSRFNGESWQYTNRLHAAVPLCGAWRFDASRTSAGDVAGARAIDRLNNDFADFSRSETDHLITETQSIAENNTGVFLGETAGPGLHDETASLIASHQGALDQRLRALVADDSGLIAHTLANSANAGWIMAGSFLLELARLQGIYDQLAAHALPSPEVPVLAKIDSLHQHLAETIAADPDLHALSTADMAPLMTFYAQIARAVRLARAWLYDQQLADMPLMLADPSDLRDEMTNAGDPSGVSSLYGHVLNDAAVANGVWNGKATATTPRILADRSVLALPTTLQNPVAALAEFGHRQASLGTYLFGIAGPDVAPPGTLAQALLLGATGLGFMASGFALIFLVPLLPFIRFFVGVLTWLLSLFEAVIAVPLVALAHLNISGEGLSGGAARQAYLLWLNIIIRPALILFGLIAGLLLFTFAIGFLDLVFHQLMSIAAPAGGEGFVAINVGLTFFYTVLAVAAANVSFKGITFLPEMALKWLGSFSLPERGEPPVAVATSVSGTPGLPGLSPAALLTQRANSGTSASFENRIIAAARSYGMALFPQYGGSPKSGGDEQPKANTGTDRQERITSSASTANATSTATHRNPGAPRAVAKPEERRKGNTDNLGADNMRGRDVKMGVPVPEDNKVNPPDSEFDPS